MEACATLDDLNLPRFPMTRSCSY